MTSKKIMTACFLPMLFLTILLTSRVSADEVGTITISPMYGKQVVSGGDLNVYQVASWSEENNTFKVTEDFSRTSIEDLLSSDVSQKFIQTLALESSSKSPFTFIETIPTQGVVLNDVPKGIYLFVQNKASNGFEKMSPFLISIPNNGAFNVDAKEKMSPLQKKGDKPKTVDPRKDVNNSKHDKELPFTGQLWWPVYTSFVIGLLCLVLSMIGNKHVK